MEEKLGRRSFGKRLLLLFIVSILIISSSYAMNIDENKRKQISQEKSLNMTIKDRVNQQLDEFSSGFIENKHIKSDHINFFIQNKNIAVGFSESSVEFVLATGQQRIVGYLNFRGSNQVSPVGYDTVVSNQHFITRTSGTEPTSAKYYKNLIYKNIYDNIDLHYILQNGQLKYEFYVYPGGNVHDIQLSWNGASILSLSGGIQILFGEAASSTSSMLDSNPVVFQSVSRDTVIESSFRILDQNSYGFNIPNYNKDKLLIIDPILEFSTYVAGSLEDYLGDMTLDSSDNIYVTGWTKSTDFPTSPTANGTTADTYSFTLDAFVLKLSSDGTTLLYSTYITGSGNDWGYGIRVDSSGNALVAGRTSSTDFPVTTGAMNSTRNGGIDVFVLKLSADGSTLVFSTYFGGSGDDDATAIEIDGSNNIYITGTTDSSDFPTSANANDTTFDGTYSDAFVMKMAADGSSIIYSTYLGGYYYENGYDIAVDSSGYAYVTGTTYSNDFPTTVGANDRVFTGLTDAYTTKVSMDGSYLVYSTYTSIGYSTDDGRGIVVDSSGQAYITGNYYTSNLMAIYVIQYSADGSTKLHTKSMPANDQTYGRAISLDSTGNIYVGGFSYGSDFPTTSDALNTTGNSGQSDGVVFRLSPDMSVLNYSTYLEGSGIDEIWAIAISSKGNITVAGQTNSTNFPTTLGVYNSTGDSSKYDIFVSSISQGTDTTSPIISGSSTFSYELGTTGNEIIFNLWDEHPSYYNLTRNGVLIANKQSWSNGQTAINVDYLGIGSYEFNITVADAYNRIDFRVVTLTVIDTTPPVIDTSPNPMFEYGSTGNNVTWTVNDAAPGTYNITLDDILITDVAEIWSNSKISVNVDNLAKGSYVLNITVTDANGNYNFMVVTLSIVDTLPPVITGPMEVSYELGSTGNNVTWTLSDAYPNTYNITLEGTLITGAAEIWGNGQISINVDNLAIGTYELNITVTDSTGDYSSMIVTVTVVDTTSPVIDTPLDVSYELGSTGNNITWTVSDLDPSVYNVTINGDISVTNSIWDSGMLTINVDGLSVGTYYLEIVIYDGSNNNVTDSVTIQVYETSNTSSTADTTSTSSTAISSSTTSGNNASPSENSSNINSSSAPIQATLVLFWPVFILGLLPVVIIKKSRRSD